MPPSASAVFNRRSRRRWPFGESGTMATTAFAAGIIWKRMSVHMILMTVNVLSWLFSSPRWPCCMRMVADGSFFWEFTQGDVAMHLVLLTNEHFI